MVLAAFVATPSARALQIEAATGWSSNIFNNAASVGTINSSPFLSAKSEGNLGSPGSLASSPLAVQWEAGAKFFSADSTANSYRAGAGLSWLKVQNSGDQLAVSVSASYQVSPTVFRERDPVDKVSFDSKLLLAGSSVDQLISTSIFLENHFEAVRASSTPDSLTNPPYEDDHFGWILHYEPRYYFDESAEKFFYIQPGLSYRSYLNRFARLTNGVVDVRQSGHIAKYLLIESALGAKSESKTFPWTLEYGFARELDFAYKAEDRWLHRVTLKSGFDIYPEIRVEGAYSASYSKFDNWIVNPSENDRLWTFDWGPQVELKWEPKPETKIRLAYSYNRSNSKYVEDRKSSQEIVFGLTKSL
ncbi:MAG: hypothetical protein ABIO95_07590 [Bdellovibrionota bacterium]